MAEQYGGTPMEDVRGYLRPAEVSGMIKAADTTRNRLLVELLWMTGARISEIVGVSKVDAVDKQNHLGWGLKPDMLDPEENVLVINTLKRRHKDGRYIPLERRVEVPSRLMRELVGYIQTHAIAEDERVFPISRRWANELVHRTALAAGVKPPGKAKRVHPHHLRHSHCIQFIKHNDGMEGLKALQSRLKHTNIATTAHYLQFSSKGRQENIEEVFK